MPVRTFVRFLAALGMTVLTRSICAQNFTGACGDLVVNSGMIGRVLSVAAGLLGVCFAIAAQQASDSAFALNLYRPKISSVADHSILFHKGPVRAWSDGGRLASNNALAEIGMVSLDLFPVAYLPPNSSGVATAKKGSAAADSSRGTFESDGKDLPGMMMSLPDQVYYGGEVGVLYGRWTGKGGGDLMQSYILGTVGNDKIQITVGAEYDESSGRTVRFRSLNGQR